MRVTDNKNKILLLILGLAFLCSLYGFFIHLRVPICDEHGFRQTQTAISSFWMAKEWNFFAYETPVLGFPWSIPFEFPLFQAIVALLHKVFPFFSLAGQGRLVSWLFYLATLYPASKIFDTFFEKKIFYIFCICYLVSPYYMFWGSSFMIESTALFFSTLSLWSIIKFSDEPTWKHIVEVTLWSSIGGVVKITSVPSFLFMGCFYILYSHKQAILRKDMLIKILFSVFIFFFCLYTWTHWADMVKAQNPNGWFLTSKNLWAWNFSTLEQRLSPVTWKTILSRNIYELLGYMWCVLPLSMILLADRQYRLKLTVLIVLFLIPILIFTNLYFIHNYYQFPTAIFILIIVSLFFSFIYKYNQILFIAVMLLFVCLSAAFSFKKLEDYASRTYISVQLGTKIQEITKEDTAVIALGWDWSPELLYFSERKGIAMPHFNYSPDRIKGNATITGGKPVSVVIDLNPNISQEDAVKRDILIQGMKKIPYYGTTIYYNPDYCLID